MKYFSIKELARSDIATRLGIDNTPTEEAVQNLHHLVDNVLDPLREAYGHPIYVNSGYRCPALNKAVMGARNSYHMRGQAADIRPAEQATKTKTKTKTRELGQLIIDLGLPFDQLIYYPTFLHVSWSTTPRHQVLHF